MHGSGDVWKSNLNNNFTTDSVQSSSNKCKNYLLKIYSQHINFLNTI